MPERSVNPDQHEQGLVVVGLDLCGALEMPRRFVEFSLGEAGAGMEIMGLERVGIEGERLIELGHRLRVSLAQ
jgi:hypothetical protein